MSELLEPYRSTYFISGEINSEVADPDAKMAEIEERYGAAGRAAHLPPRRRQRRLRRLALQRAPVEHRAAAAPVPGEPRVRGGHGAPPGRGPGPDPRLVIHRLPVPTPFAVGRVNVWLVEDDPLTLVDAGPNSATSLTELEARPARARAARRGPRADRGHPPAHGPHRPGRPPGHPRPGGGGRPRPPGPLAGALRREHGGGRRLRGGGHAAPRHPARVRAGPARGHPGLPRVGPPRRCDAHRHRRRDAGLRGADLARAPPPRALPLGHDLPRRGLRRGARRRPPPGPHLVEPARLAPARGRRPRRTARGRS